MVSLALTVIVALIAALIGCLIGWLMCVLTTLMANKDEYHDHDHKWSNWSNPYDHIDNDGNHQLRQYRFCTICNCVDSDTNCDGNITEYNEDPILSKLKTATID